MSTILPLKGNKKKKVAIDENDYIRINDDDFFGRGIETILSQLWSIPISKIEDIAEQMKFYNEKRKIAFSSEEAKF